MPAERASLKTRTEQAWHWEEAVRRLPAEANPTSLSLAGQAGTPLSSELFDFSAFGSGSVSDDEHRSMVCGCEAMSAS